MTEQHATIPAPPLPNASQQDIAAAEMKGNQRAHGENAKLRAKIERLERKIAELEVNAAVQRNRTRYVG